MKLVGQLLQALGWICLIYFVAKSLFEILYPDEK